MKTWSTTRVPQRPGPTARSPATGPVEAELSLPRHVLVALAAIAADVTSLRQQAGDDPQVGDPLGRILGKVDALVDSIYQRAAEPQPRPNVARGADALVSVGRVRATVASAPPAEHRGSRA